jgi:hypothetical protein
MRRILIFTSVCTLISCVVCFSQEKISGIGKLKIFSSVTELKNMGFKNMQKVTEMKIMDKKNTLYEIISDTVKGNKKEVEGYYNPNIRVFYIPELEIAKDVIIHRLKLVYYRDSLINAFASEVWGMWKKEDGIKQILDVYKNKYKLLKIDKNKNETQYTSYFETISLSVQLSITIEFLIGGETHYFLFMKDATKNLNLLDEPYEKRILQRKSSFNEL